MLIERVAKQVENVTNGKVSSAVAIANSDRKLVEMGLSSLNYLRLVNALEIEFGVFFDFEDDTEPPLTVKEISDYLANAGAGVE
ncbi:MULTISPECIES: hypothetical protein [unclassified Nocardiopsis]|uniref:hypothetical protein n=1 Tax=unclassified Nocardiopsis TaxID=2649073 RepID=UPI00135B8D81|nr:MULTISPECIES: hypothetical protein [unclassified Nocardiopsis]